MFLLFFFEAFSSLQVNSEITATNLNDGVINTQRDIRIDSSIDNFAEVSTWDINYGAARYITVKGDLAFVSAESSFLILNYSNPADFEPIFTFNFNTNFVPGKVAVTNDYAFLPVFDFGVFIFDIRNSSSIYLTHHISDPTFRYQSINIEGNFLFINNPFLPGVKIYNITKITNPTFMGQYTGEVFERFDVDGDFLYGITPTKLVIVDVSNPSSPSEEGSYTRGDRDFCDLVASGDYCYIASGAHGLHIVNVATKSSPSFSGEFYDSDGGYACSLCYENDYVYLADGYNCLEIIDVSNRVSPSEVGDFDETGEWIASDISGNSVLLCGIFYTNKVLMVDVSVKDSPSKAGEFSMGGYATGIWVENDYVFLCNLLDGLNVLDTSVIYDPTLISNYNDGYGGHEIFVRDDVIYLAAYFDGFRMINWSIPTSLQEIYEDSTSMDDTRGVTVSGDYAYVIDQTYGLYSFNVTDPQAVVQLDHFYEDGAGHNLVVDGDYLYLANGFDGLYIINVTDPSNLDKVSEFTYTDCYPIDVCVKDDIAYIADMNNGLTIINVTVKDAPVKITEIADIYCLGVFINDSRLYVAASNDGLIIYDINNPATPTHIDTFNDGGNAEDVFVSGEYVYVADASDGLEILGADSDDDKLADILETDVYGTNQNDADSDSDGLTDGSEVFVHKTDPMNNDTDVDGLTDGEEVNTYHTNPLDSDTDNDNYTDKEEIDAGTDPLDPNDYPSTPTTSKKFSLFGNFVSIILITTASLVIIPIINQRKKL